MMLAGSYLFFFALYHKCDVMQLDFRGRSGTRKWLRNSLITRYLHMTERGHDGLTDGDFLNCMFFQVEQLVADGWHSFLLMIRFTVQILSNLAFQLFIVAYTTSLPLWPILVSRTSRLCSFNRVQACIHHMRAHAVFYVYPGGLRSAHPRSGLLPLVSSAEAAGADQGVLLAH